MNGRVGSATAIAIGHAEARGCEGRGPRSEAGVPSYFSFGFADPDARLGYAYVMNKLDFYLENDPREKALRDAVYRAMSRLA